MPHCLRRSWRLHFVPRWCLSLASSTYSTSRDLFMFNSLSGQLDPFPRATSVVPNVLKWYACGPTVYDRAHLGHARAYVSQDILRRVAERTGGYKIQLVMGVTDVDDKIIARAKELNVSYHVLAREQEQQFFKEMTKLYVKPPTAITRVSEHVVEIVKYVEGIINQGFAYEAEDGSGVYFDTQQLGKEYGKLDPSRQMPAIEPSDVDNKGKKDPRDFVLWKTTKEPEEPAWPSPWGSGRPGWHIECSAMTHHVLGSALDVHTGGVDLRFPHHNNEIAQCEAYNFGQSVGSDRTWCKHFVHFGHLHIRGRKMSKSLKNFISVQEFFSNGYTADQFRVFCLQYKYRANLMFSEDRVRDAEAVVERLRSFFQNVVAYGETSHYYDIDSQNIKSKRCGLLDLKLLETLFVTRSQVDEALLNDLDTPRALGLIMELVSSGNSYVLSPRNTKAPDEVLWSLVDYVLEVFDLFGLEGLHAEFSGLMCRRFPAFRLGHARKESNDSSHEHESLLRSLIAFRASVRQEALRDPKQPSNARVLALCDSLRNEELPRLGIQVEDLAPGRSVYKLLSRSECESPPVKSVNKVLPPKQQEFESLMQIVPADFFKKAPEFAGRFHAFDTNGFPTHENDVPLTKTQRKKLAKRLAKHEKSYNKYWQATNCSY